MVVRLNYEPSQISVRLDINPAVFDADNALLVHMQPDTWMASLWGLSLTDGTKTMKLKHEHIVNRFQELN